MAKTYNIISNLLENDDFNKWCIWELTEHTLVNTNNENLLAESKEIERLFWNSMIWTENNKWWSWILWENAVKLLLVKLWHTNVHKIKKDLENEDKNKYKPDLECDCDNDFCKGCIWEVKCRNWTTTWTAWEKILWTPLKYSELPLLYTKPLKIITIWFQEYEAKKLFKCWDLVGWNWNKNFNKILKLFKKLNIEYIWFTDLLKEIE